MPSPEVETARVWWQFRWQYLGAHAEGPLSIAHLRASAPVTRQAVTKHLHALVAAGLVRSKRRGRQRQRILELEPRRLQEARRYLDRISEQWDDALEQLRAFIEE